MGLIHLRALKDIRHKHNLLFYLLTRLWKLSMFLHTIHFFLARIWNMCCCSNTLLPAPIELPTGLRLTLRRCWPLQLPFFRQARCLQVSTVLGCFGIVLRYDFDIFWWFDSWICLIETLDGKARSPICAKILCNLWSGDMTKTWMIHAFLTVKKGLKFEHQQLLVHMTRLCSSGPIVS